MNFSKLIQQTEKKEEKKIKEETYRRRRRGETVIYRTRNEHFRKYQTLFH